MEPACAKACPTESIHFGPLDEMRERAFERLEVLHVAGESSARLYGEDPGDGVGGAGLDLPAPRRARGLRPAARSGRRPRATWARCGAPRRARARRCWPGSRWRASGAGGERLRHRRHPRLLLRAADPQGARVEVGDPGLLLLRRHGGRRRALRPAQRAARRRGARAPGVARRHGRRGGEPAAPGRRPRPARALPPHAARAQADLADERRLVGPRGQQHGHRLRQRAQPSWAGSRAWAAWRAPPRSSGPRSRPTPRCSWPTRPSPRGTRPAASCPSSSPRVRR